MKRIFTLLALCALVLGAMAQKQYFYEWKDNTLNIRTTEEVDSITFDIPSDAATLTTGDPISIGNNTMTAEYSLSTVLNVSNGSAKQGVCYSSENTSPSINDSRHTLESLHIGTWAVTLSGLSAKTKYYYRSFLKLGNEVFYGPVKSFTTSEEEKWLSLGKATFVDGIITSIFRGVAEDPYEVEIQENKLVPGQYRLVNPYTKAYPLYPSESIIFDDTKDYYLEIHAEDPEAVWFGETDLGLDMGYGKISAVSIADFYVQRGDDPALVKERGYYGTLKDGEITFPVKSILYTMPGHPSGENWYYANTNGQFSILLPGYVKRDYSAILTYTGTYSITGVGNFARAELTLGADATDARAIVMPADADVTAVTDAIAAGELSAMAVQSGTIDVPFNAEELGGSNFQIIVAVLKDAKVMTIATALFEYYAEGKNPWQSIGTGYYTDDILSSYWGLPPVTYEVEILEHSEKPGLYRLVNPYNNKVYPAEYVQVFAEQLGNSLAPEGYYLEVNAMDAEGVYIQRQSLGLDFVDGEWAFESEGAYYLQGYTFESVKNAGFLGKVLEGVVMLPTFSMETGGPTDGAGYQGRLYRVDGAYYSGTNSKIEIVLPGANAFARNMAKAKADSSVRNAGKLSPAGIKASRKRARFLNRAVEVYANPNL